MPDNFDTDVLVVGAGATGLTLANELVLAGIRAMVVERLPHRTGQSKALAVQPRTAEILDSRGWLEPLQQYVHASIPAGHFAGLPLDYSTLDTQFPFQLAIEQARIEELLEDQLIKADTPVLRGHSCVEVQQNKDAVSAAVTLTTNENVAEQREITARFLVAADGAHSDIRRLLRIPFPGREARMRLGVADIRLSRKPADVGDEWTLPQFGAGALGYLLPLGAGVYRVLFGGEEQQALDSSEMVTHEEVQRALTVAYGDEIEVDEILWASRFSDASRQVEHYRHGRVFLAGDAAHIHLPAGGQGLNLGIQDAVNLGWKLAAAVHGWASPSLLDSYHDERHPVAARVLVNTRAQGVLTVPDVDIAALRQVFGELLDEPSANRRFAGEISGIGLQYAMTSTAKPTAAENSLLGKRVPDWEVTTKDGHVRVHELLRDGRAILLDWSGTKALQLTVKPWLERVRYFSAIPDGETTSVLIRPDGYICWVGDTDDAIQELADALTLWFGEI